MINEEELRRMYLVDHLTMEEIGVRVGCTRQNVFYHLRKFAVDVSGAEKFQAKCDVCGKEYLITRARFKKSVSHFCSKDCYTQYMHNPGYVQWRNGQRIAREAMENSIGRRLVLGEVVHHVDGNCGNNEIGNLKLFRSASEHAKHHHEIRRG